MDDEFLEPADGSVSEQVKETLHHLIYDVDSLNEDYINVVDLDE